MVRFFLVHLSEEASFMEIFFILLPLLQNILVIFCNSYFLFYILITKQKELAIFAEIVGFLKKDRTMFSKIKLLWFTVFVSIPNVILINNGRSFWFTTTVYCIGVIIFQVYPAIAVIFFLKFLVWFESLVFGTLRDNVQTFKKFLISIIFDNDVAFSEAYIMYFYGNPVKASVKQASSLGSAVLLGIGLGKNQQLELQKAETMTANRVANFIGKNGTPEMRRDMFHKEYKNVVQDHCPQLQLQADAKIIASKVIKGLFES